MGSDGADMRIYLTRPASFNFLNETMMKIIMNKWGGVAMGVTCPESALLSSLTNHISHETISLS